MRILSFDIGITNLGYAILNDSDNENVNDIVVESLGVIDILGNDMRRKCEGHVKKTGNQCTKKANMQAAKRRSDDWHYYCKTHLPKNRSEFKSKAWKPKNAKTTSIQDLSVAVISSLSEYNFEENVNIVLVENQPGRATQRIKAVQFVLYTYYVLKGIMNNDSPISDVKLTSPKKKLRIYCGPNFTWVKRKDDVINDLCLLEPSVKNKKSREYRKRKMLGMAHTQRILTHPGDCIRSIVCEQTIVDGYLLLSKKDDACDALLQGLSYYIEC